ncbi:MAG: hypothetical protein ACLFMT_06690 [Halobacteriales archaeon]
MKPRHVEGVCDVGDCREVATYALESDDVYVEVCREHVGGLEGFDSDFERVEHDSPYRGEPREKRDHHCGGSLLVFDVEGGEYHVCTGCDHALIIEDTGEDSVRVRRA